MNYHSENNTYDLFIDSLKTVFSQNEDKYGDIYQLVSTAIPRHYGSYVSKQDCIPLNIQGEKYKMFARLEMYPECPVARFNEDKNYEFYPYYKLVWQIPSHGNAELTVDYSLFEYLHQLTLGKLSITYENEKNIRFGNFVRHLASISDKSKWITIANSNGEDLIMRETFNRIQIK